MLWAAAGFVNEYVAMAAVVGVFGYLIAQNKFGLVIVSYLLLLVFSDSRHGFLNFAITIKPIMTVLLGVISFLLTNKNWAKNSLLQFYIPFFVFVAITAVFNPNLNIFLKSLSVFLIIYLVPTLANYALKKDREYFLKLFFYSLGILLMLGLALRVVSPALVLLNERYTGVLGNPNGLGIFITVYYFLFQVTLYYFPRLFDRRIKYLLYFLIFASLILSQSRNAMLNIAVFHVFMFLNKRSVALSFIVLGVIIASYGFLLTFAISIIQWIGIEEFARIETLEDGSGRTIAWDYIWDKIERHNYWFGTGVGSTEQLFKENYTMLSRMGHQGNAHNSFLTLWYDLGVFGMIAFLIGFIGNMIKTVKNYIAFPIAVGLLLSANFESWLSASLNPFHIGAILIITLLHYVTDEKINEKRAMELQEEKLAKQRTKQAQTS
jgi:hypothetical protein